MPLGILAAARAKADPPIGDEFWGVVQFLLDGSLFSSNQRIGWSFTVQGESLTVNRLRLSLPAASSPERVILHRNQDGAVLATAQIMTSAADAWVEAAVSPVILIPGDRYTISSASENLSLRNVRRANTVSMNPSLASIQSVSGAGHDFPATTSGNLYRFCDFGYAN